MRLAHNRDHVADGLYDLVVDDIWEVHTVATGLAQAFATGLAQAFGHVGSRP